MGLVHIYFGDGKGKTTAATGLLCRALGYNHKVIFSQFLKCDNSGEVNFLKNNTKAQVFVCNKTHGFFPFLKDEEKNEVINEARELWEKVKKSIEKNTKLLVLDEILDIINYGIISDDEIIDFISKKPQGLEVILTGRNPSDKLLKIAHYVTEFKKHKHPFDEKIKAREGIEF